MIEPIFELRFESLFKAGSGYSFRCDAQGKVELDQMSHAAGQTTCTRVPWSATSSPCRW
jgi:hypothetical protein